MIIYKITNLLNGDCYVGKTTGDVEERWYQHIRNAKYGKDYYLSRAIRKYGERCFIIEPLEEDIEGAEELNEAEKDGYLLFCQSIT